MRLPADREVEILSRFVTEDRLERLERTLAERDWGLVVVGDRIRNPHNTSALLRSAEAFGVARAWIVDDRDEDDPGYRLCRGVALGAQKWLPVEFMAQPAEAVARAGAEGYEIVVADNDPGAVPVTQLQGAGRVALVLGSELEGLHPDFRAAASRIVRVDLRGFTTSLNVSCAAAVLLYFLSAGAGRKPEAMPPGQCMEIRRDWLRRTVRHWERIIREVEEREES